MAPYSRRQVIKALLLGTAFSNVIGRAWASPLLFQLQSSKEDGFVRVNLGDFPELANANGSVRLSTSAIDPSTRKQVGLFPPLIINRGTSADDFYAMSAACTHEECVVGRLSRTSGRMVCPCHGSQYRVDGTVIQGPALQSLLRYNVKRDGDILQVDLPDLFYEMSVEKLSDSDRIKVSFIGFEAITYQVYFREAIHSQPRLVNFSSSATGPLDQMEIPGADDYANVFVERPGRTGLFEIAMKTEKI